MGKADMEAMKEKVEKAVKAEEKAKRKELKKQMKAQSDSFWKDFKKFITKGNVIDMAVGVVIGSAFSAIVNGLVKMVINPCIALIPGAESMDNWKTVLQEAVLDEAGAVKTAEVAIRYGNTIAIILDFIIIAFAVFCMVKALNSLHKKKEEPAPEPAPEEPPAPTAEELLAEIRDLLKDK